MWPQQLRVETTRTPEHYNVALQHSIQFIGSAKCLDRQGKLVDSVNEGMLTRGIYQKLYNAEHLGSGAYYFRLFIDDVASNQ